MGTRAPSALRETKCCTHLADHNNAWSLCCCFPQPKSCIYLTSLLKLVSFQKLLSGLGLARYGRQEGKRKGKGKCLAYELLANCCLLFWFLYSFSQICSSFKQWFLIDYLCLHKCSPWQTTEYRFQMFLFLLKVNLYSLSSPHVYFHRHRETLLCICVTTQIRLCKHFHFFLLLCWIAFLFIYCCFILFGVAFFSSEVLYNNKAGPGVSFQRENFITYIYLCIC